MAGPTGLTTGLRGPGAVRRPRKQPSWQTVRLRSGHGHSLEPTTRGLGLGGQQQGEHRSASRSTMQEWLDSGSLGTLSRPTGPPGQAARPPGARQLRPRGCPEPCGSSLLRGCGKGVSLSLPPWPGTSGSAPPGRLSPSASASARVSNRPGRSSPSRPAAVQSVKRGVINQLTQQA